MNDEVFRASIGRLHVSLTEIAENIRYVSKELPVLTIPDVKRLRIAGVCEEFDGTVLSVRKHLRHLEDQLGLHPGEDPSDPKNQNVAPGVTMDSMVASLRTAIHAMHQTVLNLNSSSKEYPGLGLAYMLVGESATNILNAFSTVEEALNTIRAELDRPQPPAPPLLCQCRFICRTCGEFAGLVELFDQPLGGAVVRSGFLGGRRWSLRDAAALAPAFRAISSGDVREVFAYNLELAPYFCPTCGLIYCSNHWKSWDVYEDDGWHDCIRGTCPQGHERMLED